MLEYSLTISILREVMKCYRDLEHRKTYAVKVNSDPILLIYTKVYKQHYARSFR